MESYTDILRGREKSGCGLETISFLTVMTKDGSRLRGMFYVCLRDKDRKIQQLQGTIIIQRNFIDIYLCLVAWEMENQFFCFMCSISLFYFSLIQKLVAGFEKVLKLSVQTEPRTPNASRFFAL